MHSQNQNEIDQNTKKLQTIVESFTSAPFLFIGSGLSRRYLNAPSWEELLEIFAKKIRPTYAFQYYESKAKEKYVDRGIEIHNKNTEIYPLIASLIRSDFNKRWFDDTSFHSSDPEIEEAVKEKHSDPFHAEVAAYFRSLDLIDSKYDEEIAIFKKICVNRIAGIITTNYDCLLEDLTGFQPFIGQQGLLSTDVQGIGEIYKIHGSVKSPNSIVLDEEDYNRFKERMLCLSAKLITIFIENPIIFIGYSLSDSNIKEILASIIGCLDSNDLEKLQQRLYFVEYTESKKVSIEPQTYSLQSSESPLRMTNIKINDFKLLFSAFESFKPRFPVKKLRMLKAAFVEFIVTNDPSEKIKVGNIDNNDISDYDLGLYIGKTPEIDSLGYKGIKRDEIFRDIILDTQNFDPKRLITETFPDCSKASSGSELPIYKYLQKLNFDTSIIPENVNYGKCYDDLITPSTIKKRDRNSNPEHRSINKIIQYCPPGNYSSDKNPELAAIRTQCRLMEYLFADEIDCIELGDYLIDILNRYPNLFNLTNEYYPLKNYFRKMIRIYDYLKYSKKSHE